MKNILLIGDVGKGKKGFYHIGDEAMFFYNYKKLKQHHCNIYVAGRSLGNGYKNEILDIHIKGGIIGIFKILFISLFYKYYKTETKVGKLVQVIKNVDDIIISGGGNLNSIWPGHLYYRFFIALLTQKFNKRLFLSGQTIGPIKGFIDKYILKRIVHNANVVFIRDKSYSTKYLPYSEHNKITYGYDDALAGINNTNEETIIQKNKQNTYIGISFHPYKKNETQLFSQIVQQINQNFNNVTIIAIPHVLNDEQNDDSAFMEKILVRSGIKNYQIIDYALIKNVSKKNNIRYEETIEKITSQMDIVVTTRYHGAVFGYKSAIPTIMIGRNEYEIGKFEGLSESLGIESKYVTNLHNDTIESIKEKIKNLYSNQKKIKMMLKTKIDNLENEKIFIEHYIQHYL